jgi:hypothetical protein
MCPCCEQEMGAQDQEPWAKFDSSWWIARSDFLNSILTFAACHWILVYGEARW